MDDISAPESETSANMKLMMAELSYVWPTSIAPVSEASGVSEMCTSIHYFWCCGTVAAAAKTSTLYLLFKKKKKSKYALKRATWLLTFGL